MHEPDAGSGRDEGFGINLYRTRAASSPSQSSLRDASSPKVGALGSPCKLHLFAKASPFGRGGCDHWEQTERASPLAAVVAVAKQLGSIQKIQAASLEDFLCSADFESLRDET